jgi:prevent-host-death family protein
MQTISINELRQNLSLYLEKVKNGSEIIVEETGEAIARILPFDTTSEDARLVAEGLMRLPKRELPKDFWDEDAPEISLEEIVKAVRSERDED